MTLTRRHVLTLGPVWKRRLGPIAAFLLGLVGGAGGIAVYLTLAERWDRRMRARPHRVRIARRIP